MRPAVTDIAAPDFPPGLEWVNAKSVKIELLLAAGPVLVWFWDFAQLNSIRALPYLRKWNDRYRGAGLRILGVHSPRFPFTRRSEEVRAAVARLELGFPVALDSEFLVWRDYGNEGWPALFLWSSRGVLAWFHFGEGEYSETEEAIREQVREADPAFEPPDPLPPLRPSDASQARVLPPTPEIFPGGSADQAWTPTTDADRLELDYEAAGAYVTIEGEGSLGVELDGSARDLPVDTPGLYELADHDGVHGSHHLELRPTAGQRIYSLSFAPGVPG